LEDGSVPLQNMPDPPFPPQYEPSEDVKPKPPSTLDDHSPTDLRAARSFESKESRPTSPHNVTSPASKWSDIQPHNFLSVPNARSRGSSVDSDEPGHSPTSYGGDTYVPSPASSGLEQHSRPSGTQPDHDHIINDADALKPDPGTEADFQVVDNRFAFSPGQLSKLLNPKSLSAFYALGGLSGIEKGLRTNRDTGLSADETGLDGSVSFEDALNAAASRVVGKDEADDKVIETSTIANEIHPPTDGYVDRKRIFKENRLPEKKTKSILELAWIAYNDKVLMLLTAAALVSLALGIYQSRSGDPEEKVQWVEGVAIAVAIIIVVLVGAANDWQKERQFVKLNKKKDERNVKVIRSGKSREISVHDILVGDVMHLEAGDMIPVDGIFISGHNLTCDESSATGESDLLRKTPGDDVYAALAKHQSTRKMDPFIISGGKVTEGIGTFIVTAVGIYSSYGRTMMSLREPPQTTPLQMKLNILAEYIAKLGLTAGLVLFTATFIKFLAGLNEIEGGAAEKGKQFVRVFIVAVTIVVVAVPEGLPLAVTLALAFATIRMLKDNNLVRLLKACETMGNATTICSDKTGTLTQNKMSTVAAVLGTSARFGDKNVSSSSETSSPQSPVESKIVSSEADRHDGSIGRFVSSLDEDVKSLLMQSIAVNSTAFEGAADGQEAFVGSKTETALLSFARDHLGMGPLNEERANANVVQMVPFDSGRKCMAAVVKLHDSRYRMLVKGASEILLGKCSKIIQDPTKGIAETDMSHEYMEILTDTITSFASRSLRTIGLVYRDFDQWPPKGAPAQVEDPTLAVFDKVFIDMVFLGIVGIQDPLRVGVAEAVRQCQMAGVYVRMVTGDNILTAKAIAQECGIHTPGGLVMEGPHFRKLDRREMNAVIPKLQVLARSSPEDKRILVKRLKELGETVAVTGDGTNDAPALKTADVGFSMGIAGTEVAKEASAIVLLDDNFASIVKAIMWGRAVNDAVQKFLQVSTLPSMPSLGADGVPVPNHGEHHRRLPDIYLRRVQRHGNIGLDCRSAALGQSHHGHPRGPGISNGPAYPEDPQPQTPAEIGSTDHVEHVEDDHWAVDLSACSDSGSLFSWGGHLLVHGAVGTRSTANRHFQYIRIHADF
jgi:Ca2+-transporting ATPase